MHGWIKKVGGGVQPKGKAGWGAWFQRHPTITLVLALIVVVATMWYIADSSMHFEYVFW